VRNRILMAAAFATALIGAVAATSSKAVAAGTSLTVCNQSSTEIDVAVGYHSSGPNDTSTLLTGPFVSVGWWVIPAGKCTSMANPFAARYMYWSGYLRGGDWLWTAGDYHFCAPHLGGPSMPTYTFESQNASDDACTGATAYDSFGANTWIAAREVDVEVNATATYTGL